MTTALATLRPQTMAEAMKYAEVISKSDMLPKGFKGRPADILVAMQYGAELGLQPLQAMQNIAVINGRPTMYGDALLAVVQGHPDCLDVIETFSEAAQSATCTVKRKGRSDTMQVFSQADAKKAGLWGKGGPWTQYPRRMLQMRARSWALRDAFADALRGIQAREEVDDYGDNRSAEASSTSTVAAIVEKAKANRSPAPEPDISDAEVITEPQPEAPSLPDVLRGFTMAETEAELKAAGAAARGLEGKAKEEATVAYQMRREQLRKEADPDPNDFGPPALTDEDNAAIEGGE